MKTILFWVLTLLSGQALAEVVTAQDEPDALRGSHFFRSYCVVCHGPDGKGAGPLARKLDLAAADLSAPKYQSANVEELVAIIGGYVKQEGSRMPVWKQVFSASEMRDIATYVRDLTRKTMRLSGDTRRGRAIFRTACIACHGRFGTGKGVLSELLAIPMVDYTTSETLLGLSDDELVAVIRDGKGDYMPSWKEALDDKEITDVASYVRRLSAMSASGANMTKYDPNPLAGKNLYRTYCVVCHGLQGKGKGPLSSKLHLTPADLSAERYQSKGVEELAAIIGGYSKKESSNMPSWGKVLPEPDLHDIAAYLPKLGQDDLRFKGNVQRGRAVFRHACVACHGRNGAGDGILARLIKILMLDFTKSKEMLDITDEELIAIIRDGKGEYMPAWKGALDDNEVIDVASYVRRLAK